MNIITIRPFAVIILCIAAFSPARADEESTTPSNSLTSEDSDNRELTGPAEGVERKISTLNKAEGTKASESYERRKRQLIGIQG